MYSVLDTGFLIQWVSPFGYFRVKAFFRLTETFRRLRVLLRLSIPRHPPAALTNLTYIISCELNWLRHFGKSTLIARQPFAGLALALSSRELAFA